MANQVELFAGGLFKGLAPDEATAFLRKCTEASYKDGDNLFMEQSDATKLYLIISGGIELRNYFSSDVADVDGSRNLAGIKNPVVDDLINKAMEAETRAELVAAVKALDRVLRAYNYWVPHWYKASHNLAYWDRFSRPAMKPKFARGVLDTWWYDEKKAAALDAR